VPRKKQLYRARLDGSSTLHHRDRITNFLAVPLAIERVGSNRFWYPAN
jgi:hypothetical protein